MIEEKCSLTLHIFDDEYKIIESKGEYATAYTVKRNNRVIRVFADIIKCAQFLLKTYEEAHAT